MSISLNSHITKSKNLVDCLNTFCILISGLVPVDMQHLIL